MVFSKRNPTPYEIHLINATSEAGKLFRLTHALIRDHPALKGLIGFQDISDAFDSMAEAVFIDFCHINETGNEKVAERISRDVLHRMDDL